MPKKSKQTKPTTLRINRLRGRMLNLPAPRGKASNEILLVYGAHASIESVNAFAKLLNRFGSVSVPDLPGIGGMTSFYTINEQPTVDNFASYIASFIEFRYHRKRNISIVCIGEGTLFVTRMLQNHQKAASKIKSVTAIGGILHKNDIPNINSNRIIKRITYRFLLTGPVAWCIERFRFKWLIKATHSLKGQPQQIRDLDAQLWQVCDMRTHVYIKSQLLKVDLCQQKVDKNLRIIWANMPPKIDLKALEQHALIVYKRTTVFVPKATIGAWFDLDDEDYVKKSIGSKLTSWLG